MSAKYACLVGVLLLSLLPAAGGGQQIPDPVVYRFFFAHLENLDKVAAQQEARGKDGKRWRSHEQVAMGLTVDEGAAVKQVAADCNRSLKSQESRLKAAMAAVKPKTAKGKPRKAPTPELNRIFAERDQIVSQHIKQLRSRLGEAAFQKLESYLQLPLLADDRATGRHQQHHACPHRRPGSSTHNQRFGVRLQPGGPSE